MVYLDYNASTPVLPEIFKEMEPYFLVEFGNAGSRTHEYGVRANKAVENARARVAAVIKCQPGEVIFTSGATESNNLAILGLADYGKSRKRMHIATSPIEHKAVLEPINFLKSTGFSVNLFQVGEDGRIDPANAIKMIQKQTLLVSLMQVNNETGIIQPICEVAEILQQFPDVYFHVDAAQGFGKIIDQLQHPRIDLISISGHKIFAPKGIGALIIKKRNKEKIPLTPLMYGGGQEKGLRPGTLPVPLIVGLGKASEIALRENSNYQHENLKIKKEIFKYLSDLKYCINGNIKFLIPHVLNLSFKGIDSDTIFIALKNIAALSNGSACTSSHYQHSHVLKAMGLPVERLESSIRFSWGKGTAQIPWQEIFKTIGSLA